MSVSFKNPCRMSLNHQKAHVTVSIFVFKCLRPCEWSAQTHQYAVWCLQCAGNGPQLVWLVWVRVPLIAFTALSSSEQLSRREHDARPARATHSATRRLSFRAVFSNRAFRYTGLTPSDDGPPSVNKPPWAPTVCKVHCKAQ